jgi:radical SAM superfamily enzyme YgiQ (UPF0313 family)
LKHSYYKRGKRGSAVIVASRGCPMKCTYCSLGASSPLRYRRRSVESVLREVEKAITQYNVGFIDFEDENLSLEKEWFLKLLGEIKTRFGEFNLELRAMNGLFPLSLDDETIHAMKEAGFKTLNLSLGSTSKKQLNRFRRPDVIEAFDKALFSAEKYDLQVVAYVIAGAPDQKAEDSVLDLLFLAQRSVLAGVSIFYPAPGSVDFERLEVLRILPSHFSLMRSSALPISHTTTRDESMTLLRLVRILNFMKSLVDQGASLPDPLPFEKVDMENVHERTERGKRLLQGFLYDGQIRGVTPDGEVFEHKAAIELAKKFIEGLKAIRIRGCVRNDSKN